MTREGQIKRSILEYLKAQADVWSVKITSCSRSGVPDVIGCCRGRFFAMELKTSQGLPSPLQFHEQLEIIRSRGFCQFIKTRAEAVMMIEAVRKEASK